MPTGKLYTETSVPREWLRQEHGVEPLHTGEMVITGDLVRVRVKNGAVGRFVSANTARGLVHIDWNGT